MSERIRIDPEINGGKPTVAVKRRQRRCSDQEVGTRVSVQTVLGHLSAGDELQYLLAACTRLTREDVLACLEYGARLAGHAVTFEKIA